MGTLVIDRRGASVELTGRALRIREPAAEPRTIPTGMVDRLVLSAAVMVDTKALLHLHRQGCAVVILATRGDLRGLHLHTGCHGDAARRVGQYRLRLDRDMRRQWAIRFVALRLLGARRMLRRALVLRGDRRRDLIAADRGLDNAVQAVRSASTVEQLRGIEGSGARVIFRALAAIMPEKADFNGRNRRPPRDPVNAALSLGYTLAHSDAVAALGVTGLDPMIGMLHEEKWGRASLACDLVETARPGVEWMVWRLFAERGLTPEDFSHGAEDCRLRKEARRVFYAAYGDLARRHTRWMARIAQALANDCTAAATKAMDIPA